MAMSSQKVFSYSFDFLLLLFIITLMIFTAKAQPTEQQVNYFKLALQWPNSFCKNRTSIGDCRRQVPQEMTIHGLWAFDGNDDKLPDCAFGSGVDLRQNAVANIKDLEESWPSHVVGKSNFEFWRQEWNKHGRCLPGFSSAEQYFQMAVDLKLQIDDSFGGSLVKFFINQKLPPDDAKPYDAFRFLKKIKSQTKLTTQMQCNTNREGKYQLYEIRFCFTREREFKNCSYYNPQVPPATPGWKLKNCCYYKPQVPPATPSFNIGSCYRARSYYGEKRILFPQAQTLPASPSPPPVPRDEL